MNISVIILLGPPGSGKDTQAGMLARKFGFALLETSKLLRETFARESNNPAVRHERDIYKRGELNSAPFVTELVGNEIRKLKPKTSGMILNGSPRFRYEAERLVPLLEELYGRERIRALFIRIGADEIIRRLSQRLICDMCDEPVPADPRYHEGGPCPQPGCSGTLKRRDLDDPAIIQNRITVFERDSMQAVEYLRKQGLLTEVNGEQPIEGVFKEILSKLST